MLDPAVAKDHLVILEKFGFRGCDDTVSSGHEVRQSEQK